MRSAPKGMKHLEYRISAGICAASLLSIAVAIAAPAFPYHQQNLSAPPKSPIAALVASASLPPQERANLEQLLKARRYGRAEQLLIIATQQHPGSPQLLTLLGNVFFLDGKYLECAVALKKADAIVPVNRQSRFLLAMAYVAINHPGWARLELQKLQRANPQDALYPYWLSRVDYNDMHLDKAASEAQRAIQLSPHFMKAYNNLGLYEEGLGRDDEAIKAYREAMRLNREQALKSPWPALNLGSLLSKLGRFKEADACLRESLHEAPYFPKAHFQLGLLLEKQGRDTEAIRDSILLHCMIRPMPNRTTSWAESTSGSGRLIARAPPSRDFSSSRTKNRRPVTRSEILQPKRAIATQTISILTWSGRVPSPCISLNHFVARLLPAALTLIDRNPVRPHRNVYVLQIG